MQTLAATLASLASSCLTMVELKQIHARAIRSHLHTHSIVLAKIFRFLAVSPSGNLTYAQQVFDQMPQPTTFFYNILIRGYSKSTTPFRSVHLFNQMRHNCVDPDGYTLTFLLKSRSSMKLDGVGNVGLDEIHGFVVKNGFDKYLFVQNALIHLYAVRGLSVEASRVFNETDGADVVSWSGLVVAHVKAGEIELARSVFDRMPERDVVSWTAMVSGYSKAKYSKKSLELFREMMNEGVRPDEVTMVSVILACTDLGDVQTGMSVHRYIDENRFGWMVSLCNALIDMYAKCGCMDLAWQVFHNMSRKGLITWNSMISACAHYGDPAQAHQLFSRMINSGVRPDKVTFLALLSAYAHNGWIDDGYRVFVNMKREYDVEPSIEHYGCMVDMLGRAGQLEEAYNLISCMPMQSNDVVWGALLAACRTHGDLDMAKKVVEKLIELKPDEGGYYILLRDIYVATGRTAEVNEIRQTMRAHEAVKTPGFSCVGV